MDTILILTTLWGTDAGTFVRIAPNHLSISDPDALQIVYGHGTGTLKSDFYDAFVSIRRGLFNTRDRAEHTRKRKPLRSTRSFTTAFFRQPPYNRPEKACLSTILSCFLLALYSP